MSNQDMIQEILNYADVKINGTRPWDIQVHDERIYEKILQSGSLGFGEAYMEGYWSSESLDVLIYKLLNANIEEKLSTSQKIKVGFKVAISKVKEKVNRQSVKEAAKDVSSHYDIGNDLFSKMLDKRMAYTCAYWKNSDNLDDAQEAKLDLVCRKMGLKSGMRVLDIGCGWGSFMNYAAENYGVICDGITLSKEQADLGQKIADEKGLDVHFILQDYRKYDPDFKYDAVVSIGMLEHVGPANYEEYFKCASKFMKDDAVFLLHTIGNTESVTKTNGWINKYIFPNGVIPSIAQIGKATEKLLNIEDLHNIGPDYDKTLMAWYENFDKAWPELKSSYNQRFYLMWKFYLLSCAAAFRTRQISVWQIALTKVGRELPDFVRAV